MSDQSFQNFRDALDKINAIFKEYQVIKKHQAHFTKEYKKIIIELTYQYFTAKISNDGLNLTRDIDKKALKNDVFADEEIKYYGIWIFEEIIDIMNHFSDVDKPAARKCYYKKIKYPVYDDKWIEKKLREIKEECIVLNTEDRKYMRAMIKKDAIIEEFYNNFDILIHKALKKLSLKYFPEITEISGAGIREIDYLLYDYMLMTKQNIMKLLDK